MIEIKFTTRLYFFADGPCHPNPCQNNGKCQEKENDYTCICSHRFSGKNCDIGNHFHTP